MIAAGPGRSWIVVDADAPRRRRGPRGDATRDDASLTRTGAPNAAYLTDAALARARAASCAARAASSARTIRAGRARPDATRCRQAPIAARRTEAETAAARAPRRRAPASGELAVAVGNAIRPITDFNVISLRAVQREAGRSRRTLLHRELARRDGRVAARRRRRPTAYASAVGLHRGHAGERGHARLRALPAPRLPDEGSGERVAEVSSCSRCEAHRQARARAESISRAAAST